MPSGYTIMEGAVKNSIPGIDADCGGSCACATCHVYVDEKYLNKIPTAQEAERDMLDFVNETNNTSRLSCQIIITNDLEGIIVRMPKKQS
jgi:2Fe-2S ferredoxin